ncbi:MAG: tRNA uridine-5-carboxymethylaminomethyl(34) synthesis GTPase MnmE [Parvularculaceae bacterium]
MGAVRDDTIFARASGAGRAGVSVIRISGPGAADILRKLSGAVGAARVARVAILRDPRDGDVVDRALTLFFPGPASFTGEDVVELHAHGSAAVEAGLYDCLSAMGARPADAGEFTRRALINGKMDLAQVEGLGDLLVAETAVQRRQALAQADGALSAAATRWRGRLIAALAAFEAEIDFPDEEDAPASSAAAARAAIAPLIDHLATWRASAASGELVRTGATVALMGAPNAGKSSLMNAIAGEARAIVSDRPGTTRDVIEARVELGGLPARLFDAAGVRDAADEIEAEGVRRALDAAATADVRILVVDVSRETYEEAPAAARALLRDGDFVAFNKSDLAAIGSEAGCPHASFRTSAKTGDGVDALTTGLGRILADRAAAAGDAPLTRARHLAAVDGALRYLRSAIARVEAGGAAAELAAEDARMAARQLGEIVGDVDVESVLGEVFANFCIGK